MRFTLYCRLKVDLCTGRGFVVSVINKRLLFAYPWPPFVSCGWYIAHSELTVHWLYTSLLYTPQYLISTSYFLHWNATVGGKNLFPFFFVHWALKVNKPEALCQDDKGFLFLLFSCETGEATNISTSAFLRVWNVPWEENPISLCKWQASILIINWFVFKVIRGCDGVLLFSFICVIGLLDCWTDKSSH